MARRAAAPKIVVIHAGKVIVHQRVGVDAFNSAGEGKRIADVATASFSRGETENRPQSFASGKKAVAHGLVEGGRFRTRLRQIVVQGTVDLFLAGAKIFFEIHRMLIGTEGIIPILDNPRSRSVSSAQMFSAVSVVAIGFTRMARNAPRSKIAALQS